MTEINGYLEKKSGFGLWKKRWCWTTKGSLFIASSPQNISKAICIDLTGILVQEALHFTGKNFTLTLISLTGKATYLKAADSQDLERWRTALSRNADSKTLTSRPSKIDLPEESSGTQTESEWVIFEELNEACIISKMKDGRVMMCNDAACDLFGYNRNEVVGNLILMLLSNKNGRDESFLKRVKSGKKRILGRAVTKTGAVFKAEISLGMLSGGLFISKFKEIGTTRSSAKDLESKLKKLEEEMKSLKTENSILREEVSKDVVDEDNNLYFSKDPTELFKLKEIIGKGAFGAVFRGKELKTKNEVAIKILGEQADFETLKNEIQVLKKVDSPFIVKYFGTFLKDKQNWIVMEYFDAGSLADLLDRLPIDLTENHVVLITEKMLQGIKYLHKMGRIHRDIKAANVLVNTHGDCKLTDFGISAQLVSADAVRNTSIGSPYWMAPEIIEEKGHNNKVDIWSLGITCIELAEKKPPHTDKTPIRALFAITTSPSPKFSKPANWSPLLNEFLELCVNKDPKRRPSAEELLKHDLFIKGSLPPDSILVDLFSKFPIDLEACREKYGSSFTGVWGLNTSTGRRSKKSFEKQSEEDRRSREERKHREERRSREKTVSSIEKESSKSENQSELNTPQHELSGKSDKKKKRRKKHSQQLTNDIPTE